MDYYAHHSSVAAGKGDSHPGTCTHRHKKELQHLQCVLFSGVMSDKYVFWRKKLNISSEDETLLSSYALSPPLSPSEGVRGESNAAFELLIFSFVSIFF